MPGSISWSTYCACVVFCIIYCSLVESNPRARLSPLVKQWQLRSGYQNPPVENVMLDARATDDDFFRSEDPVEIDTYDPEITYAQDAQKKRAEMRKLDFRTQGW